jgi:hypothetical protein
LEEGQEASFPLFQKNYVFLLGVGLLFFSEKKAEEGKERKEGFYEKRIGNNNKTFLVFLETICIK